jgi:hypothetical protein
VALGVGIGEPSAQDLDRHENGGEGVVQFVDDFADFKGGRGGEGGGAGGHISTVGEGAAGGQGRELPDFR